MRHEVKGTPDYPFVLDLCQREEAMLVTADIEFPRHIKKYQLAQQMLLGILLLPGEEIKTNRTSSKAERRKDQAYPSRIFRTSISTMPVTTISSSTFEPIRRPCRIYAIANGTRISLRQSRNQPRSVLKLTQSIQMRSQIAGRAAMNDICSQLQTVYEVVDHFEFGLPESSPVPFSAKAITRSFQRRHIHADDRGNRISLA